MSASWFPPQVEVYLLDSYFESSCYYSPLVFLVGVVVVVLSFVLFLVDKSAV